MSTKILIDITLDYTETLKYIGNDLAIAQDVLEVAKRASEKEKNDNPTE